MTSHTVN